MRQARLQRPTGSICAEVGKVGDNAAEAMPAPGKPHAPPAETSCCMRVAIPSYAAGLMFGQHKPVLFDPRGGAVQVRAAHFTTDGGKLVYDVVLSRERAARPISGVMQLVVAGASKRGPPTSIRLQPVTVSIGRFET